MTPVSLLFLLNTVEFGLQRSSVSTTGGAVTDRSENPTPPSSLPYLLPTLHLSVLSMSYLSTILAFGCVHRPPSYFSSFLSRFPAISRNVSHPVAVIAFYRPSSPIYLHCIRIGFRSRRCCRGDRCSRGVCLRWRRTLIRACRRYESWSECGPHRRSIQLLSVSPCLIQCCCSVVPQLQVPRRRSISRCSVLYYLHSQRCVKSSFELCN